MCSSIQLLLVLDTFSSPFRIGYGMEVGLPVLYGRKDCICFMGWMERVDCGCRAGLGWERDGEMGKQW